uniref:OSJNBa0079A21.15 protein n=1 Tax=Oryza sativa subsp. japonica TaxID=39947 RepID=Q7XU94_ORYSJ|nr:OSJNBa0079A21.15 [Oryza sativa Japonica Group]
MAGFDLNPPIINWDEVEDFNGDISDLNYDFVWDYDNEDGEDVNGRSSGNDGGCNGSDDDGGGSGGGDDDSGGGGDQTTDGAVDAGGIEAFESKKKKNCGRKKLSFNPDAIKDVPLRQRRTLRDLANALHMLKTTLFRRLKEGRFRRHTNAIKFTLTEDNMKARVQFCIQMLDSQSIPDKPTFKSLYNIVYIDEKWFYRTKPDENYYLSLDEPNPRRNVKSKNFIDKVMFLAAKARPRFDEYGECTFDGKIGIFPFTYWEAAKRSSRSRERGTMELKAMTTVMRDIIRNYLIEKVLPAIKHKWPNEERGLPIFIQQDNAKTHITVDDPAFLSVAQEDGWDIRLTCQPPNSPDLNVLDLGFFAALQSLFQKSSPSNIEEIETNVIKAYEEYPADRSNHVFLTLQGCMREIMLVKGGQHYAIPHMKKRSLERNGQLLIRLQCDKQIYLDAVDFINT